MSYSFPEELKKRSRRAEEAVTAFLPKEEGLSRTLLAASNYAVRGGGKRLRPILEESAYILFSGICPGDLFGPDFSVDTSSEIFLSLAPFMAAMEMMHSASLVHDDLPAMDNDTLRRGVPSTWAKYGEDMAILAGDGLMIHTFATALQSAAEPALRLRALSILAEKSGIYGMTGGQAVDVELTGRIPGMDEIMFIYTRKTAALIEASLMIGAVLAGAGEKEVSRIGEAGRYIGLAFQIEDDILDITGTEEELGKPIGSDEKRGKKTWATIRGIGKAAEDLCDYTKRAVAIIKDIGDEPFLVSLIEYLAGRKY